MLAERLAVLARALRDRINTVLTIEIEDGPVSNLMAAFREALVHDLDEDGFADMYAQTIAYGLLSARIANPSGGNADDFTMAIPVTNPFLKELMETFLNVGERKGKASSSLGLDFDELGVSEVMDLLDAANMEAVVLDFGDKNPQEDPVIHFYELFLKEYDAKKRMQRGVFYTPRPVVSFIVRSVDELLRTEFGLVEGLADTITWEETIQRNKELEIPEGTSPDLAFVQILDPATGTGTFLVEVIGIIHRTMTEKWQTEGHNEKKIEQLWNKYVPEHLLPRLHGYELLMAPYAIAHMKIGLKLHETGYHFGSDERAQIYLTNSLEPPQDFSGTLAFAIPALAHEAEAVNAIKRDQRFTVVIGNPPYSNFGQLNRTPFVLNLQEDYKLGLNEKKLNLDDDYLKFFRLTHYTIDTANYGVVGMITNNVFVDGITHRRMRESLMSSFPQIHFLNLHGSTKKLEKAPDGTKDENVFDIQQGVGISLLVKSPISSPLQVKYADAWGIRKKKYASLISSDVSSIEWLLLNPETPHFFFVPKDFTGIEEYTSYPSISGEVFSRSNTGIQTKRDRLVYHFIKPDLQKTIDDLRTLSSSEITSRYGLPEDGRDWTVSWAKKDVDEGDGRVIQVAYHPFDRRWTYFTGRSKGFMAYPRTPLMWSALQANLILLSVRNPRRGNTDSFFVANIPVDKDSVSPFDNATFFPLYIYHGSTSEQTAVQSLSERHTNISPAFFRKLASVLSQEFNTDTGLPNGISPEDVFHYAYSLFHSIEYRRRYAEFLRIDYPRLPLTSSMALFRVIVEYGNELVAMHLMESPTLDHLITTLVSKGEFEVERVSYSDETVWIDKAKTRGFRGVPEETWNYHIGGYQVCEKWLKDRQAKGGKNPRPGRVLTDEDVDHYQKIVVALSETIRIMTEIDEVIEEHGGWPGAFVTETSDTEAGTYPTASDVDVPMAAEGSPDYGKNEKF